MDVLDRIKEQVENNRSPPENFLSKDISEMPVIKGFSDKAQPQKVDEKEYGHCNGVKFHELGDPLLC